MTSYKEENVVIAKITSKNQVTIPKHVRASLDIKTHDHIVFKTNKFSEVVIQKHDEKQEFWKNVEVQQTKYGSIDDGKISWGEDIEADSFD